MRGIIGECQGHATQPFGTIGDVVAPLGRGLLPQVQHGEATSTGATGLGGIRVDRAYRIWDGRVSRNDRSPVDLVALLSRGVLDLERRVLDVVALCEHRLGCAQHVLRG